MKLRRNNEKTVRPREQQSLPTQEPFLEPMPESESSRSSEQASTMEDLPSYRPPAAKPSILSPPPSVMAENPSSLKSQAVSKLPKIKTQKADQAPSSEAPAKDPVQGEGGADFLNWATVHYDDDRYLETYQHRAAHLMTLHGEALSEATIERLENLL